jgi:hypothetical protein
MLLFPVLVISALMIIFRFGWKRMVLGAQLMNRSTNKSRTYFQRVTVSCKILKKFGRVLFERQGLEERV